jgi:type IV pilus assembly protein PilO
MFRPSPMRSETYYTEMPVQISVQGGYHQIGSFLAELANLRRIVTVSSVHMKSSGKDDPLVTTSAEFTASAYSLNTTAAPPSGGGAATSVTPQKGGVAHAH